MNKNLQLCLIFLCATIAATISTSAFAQAKTEAISQLTATGNDIANALGIDVYKFRVPLKSKTFTVKITEQEDPDSDVKTTSKSRFTLDTDSATFEILLSFMPTDGTIRNALLSDGKNVDFAVFCEAGEYSTMNRIEIARPLSRLSADVRSVMPMTLKMHEVHSTENSLCLLEIAGRNPVAATKAEQKYPVARVSVVFE